MNRQSSCFECCAVPKITAIVLALMLLFWIICGVLAYTALEWEECKCSEELCCSVNEDFCPSRQCYCSLNISNSPYVCKNRSTTLNAGYVFTRIFFYVGFFFAILSCVSCCCCGSLKKRDSDIIMTIGLPSIDTQSVEKL